MPPAAGLDVPEDGLGVVVDPPVPPPADPLSAPDVALALFPAVPSLLVVLDAEPESVL